MTLSTDIPDYTVEIVSFCPEKCTVKPAINPKENFKISNFYMTKVAKKYDFDCITIFT